VSDEAPTPGESETGGDTGRAGGADGVYFVAFEIEHFKLFRHAQLELHPEITVLVGSNDVGKSVLLEAISL
jgi:putative ribosome biogenesis GTPase RsgA